jgi:MraZ protein
MFFSQYKHHLDSKERLTVPVRYRADLEGGAFVLQGFERNLVVMPRAAFEVVRANLSRLSLTDETARILRRKFFANAEELDLDKAGRLLIPEFLRDYAGLQSEVVLAGAGEYFEIWTPEGWQEQELQLQDTEANAKRFSALDIFTGMLPDESGGKVKDEG